MSMTPGVEKRGSTCDIMLYYSAIPQDSGFAGVHCDSAGGSYDAEVTPGIGLLV